MFRVSLTVQKLLRILNVGKWSGNGFGRLVASRNTFYIGGGDAGAGGAQAPGLFQVMGQPC
jgi:uncharacterized membrane protein YgcG